MVEPRIVEATMAFPTNNELVMEDIVSVLPVTLENKMVHPVNVDTDSVETDKAERFMVEKVRDETDSVDTSSVLPTRLEKIEEETVGAGPVSVENEPELIFSVDTVAEDTVSVLVIRVE